MNTRRSLSWIVLASAVSAGVAACGSGSAPSPSPSSQSASAAATASPSPTTMSTAADVQEITANWTAFFSPKTPTAKKVTLLQDGSVFTSALQAAAKNSEAATSSAKVTKVTVITTTEAAVTYDILLSGTPVLTKQSGTAVFVDGTWKVGVASFCGLLTLEAGGKTSSLPPACKSAT
jgi:hypothetical protein